MKFFFIFYSFLFLRLARYRRSKHAIFIIYFFFIIIISSACICTAHRYKTFRFTLLIYFFASRYPRALFYPRLAHKLKDIFYILRMGYIIYRINIYSILIIIRFILKKNLTFKIEN